MSAPEIRRRILKFRLLPIVTEILTADAPRFLAVGAQGANIVVWAEATVGDGPYAARLVGVMTGQTPPAEAEYIGTAEQSEGIVVHVYWEVLP